MDRRRLNHRDFPGLMPRNVNGDGNRSSDSSEGFCENDGDIADMPDVPVVLRRRSRGQMNNVCDTDSQEGGGSESSSNSNVSIKNVEDADQRRPNNLSESNSSDTSDSSINKIDSIVAKCPSNINNSSNTSNNSNINKRVAKDSESQAPEVSAAPAETATTEAVPSTSSGATVASPTVAVNGAAKGNGVATKTEQESDHEKDASRRPSKDESLSSSSDSPSGDEYNVYYYDPKATVSVETGKEAKPPANGATANNATKILGNLKKTEDPWDILFARAEGLYAHGHTREACILGVKLAEELLANPPDLMLEVPAAPAKNKRKRVGKDFYFYQVVKF